MGEQHCSALKKTRDEDARGGAAGETHVCGS